MARLRGSRRVGNPRTDPRSFVREHLSRLIDGLRDVWSGQGPDYRSPWEQTVAAIDAGDSITVQGWAFRAILSGIDRDHVRPDGWYVLHASGRIEPAPDGRF